MSLLSLHTSVHHVAHSDSVCGEKPILLYTYARFYLNSYESHDWVSLQSTPTTTSWCELIIWLLLLCSQTHANTRPHCKVSPGIVSQWICFIYTQNLMVAAVYRQTLSPRCYLKTSFLCCKLLFTATYNRMLRKAKWAHSTRPCCRVTHSISACHDIVEWFNVRMHMHACMHARIACIHRQMSL